VAHRECCYTKKGECLPPLAVVRAT
jgi:hypothetical protein